MKGAEGFIAQGFIAQLNADLTVNRQEVNASPMLDLVEVRTQEWCHLREEPSGVRHTYYDRAEARKLAGAVNVALGELAREDAADKGTEPSPRARRDVSPEDRYVAVREVGGGWRVLDRETWHVLAAIFAGDPAGLEGAERWARQLNSSAAMADAEKAARAQRERPGPPSARGKRLGGRSDHKRALLRGLQVASQRLVF